MVVKLLV